MAAGAEPGLHRSSRASLGAAARRRRGRRRDASPRGSCARSRTSIPKAYDPVTLDTPWVSGAATLFRRSAFDSVGGFDPQLFMYGEDVDLSWRLRARGLRLRYLAALRRRAPHVRARRRSEAAAGARRRARPTSACARATAASLRTSRRASRCSPPRSSRRRTFAGRRRGMLRAFVRFLAHWPLFRIARASRPTAGFQPVFLRLELRAAPRRRVRRVPLAARSAARGDAAGVDPDPHRRSRRVAAQALAIVRQPDLAQHRGVVIEDGPPHSRGDRRALPRPPRDPLSSRPASASGRARAGNLALARRARRVAQLPRRRRRALRRPRRGAGRGGAGARASRAPTARVGDAHRGRPIASARATRRSRT